MGPSDPLSALSGIWVALAPAGDISVRQLANRDRVLASAAPPAGFDPAVSHRLVVERRSADLLVLLDGTQVLKFHFPAGLGQACGVAFEKVNKPLRATPQCVRNLSIERL